MARPDCPRCGSDLVVAVPRDAPSEHVLELRGGPVPVAAVSGSTAHWLCRSCGQQWEAEASEETGGAPEMDATGAEPGEPEPPAPHPLDPAELVEHDGTWALGDLSASAHRLATPGTRLRRAREEAGRSLEEAAKATSIREQQLVALETDAPVEGFPAPSYARFFLREYAEFLGIAPEPLLRAFDARHAPALEPPIRPLPDPGRRRRLAGRILAAASILALLVIALLGGRGSDDDAAVGPSLRNPATARTVHDSGHVPLAPPPTREPNGVRVTIRPVQSCWIEVVSDGEVVVAMTLQPGEPVAYRAREELRLRLGNAGGVRLRVNGDRVRTGATGEVIGFTFRFEDGRVLTERG